MARDAGSELLARIERLHATTELFRSELLHLKTATKHAAARISRGDTVLAALDLIRAPLLHQNLTETTKRYEAEYRHTRYALIVLALQEGESLSEIARHMGISRQLVHRLATEAQRESH